MGWPDGSDAAVLLATMSPAMISPDRAKLGYFRLALVVNPAHGDSALRVFSGSMDARRLRSWRGAPTARGPQGVSIGQDPAPAVRCPLLTLSIEVVDSRHAVTIITAVSKSLPHRTCLGGAFNRTSSAGAWTAAASRTRQVWAPAYRSGWKNHYFIATALDASSVLRHAGSRKGVQ